MYSIGEKPGVGSYCCTRKLRQGAKHYLLKVLVGIHPSARPPQGPMETFHRYALRRFKA
jgi:hypothetical protein